MLLRDVTTQKPFVETHALSVNGNGCLQLELHHFSPAPNAIIVYIPGYLAPPQSDRKMQSVFSVAAEQGACVAQFNYIGQPAGQNPTHESLDTYWQCARAVFGRVAALGKRLIPVADSMGGLFALKLMDEYKAQTAGGILISPVPAFMCPPVELDGQPLREAGYGWNRFMKKSPIDLETDATHIFARELKYCTAYLREYSEIGGFDNIPFKIDQPVVILTSNRDGFVPPTHLEEIRCRTNACVHVVEGAKHYMTDDASIAMLEAVLRMNIPIMLRDHPHP